MLTTMFFAESLFTPHALALHVQVGQRKGVTHISCRPQFIYVLGSLFLTGKSAVPTTSIVTPFDGPPLNVWVPIFPSSLHHDFTIMHCRSRAFFNFLTGCAHSRTFCTNP